MLLSRSGSRSSTERKSGLFKDGFEQLRKTSISVADRIFAGGLHELKFRQVIRIYFTEVDGEVVLLLGGSGKRDQRREIDKARERLKDFKRRTD